MKVTYTIPTNQVKPNQVDFVPTYLNVEVEHRDATTGLWQSMKVSSYGSEVPLTEEGLENTIRIITDAVVRERDALEQTRQDLTRVASEHYKKKDQKQAVSLHQTMIAVKEKRLADYKLLIDSLQARRTPITPAQVAAMQQSILQAEPVGIEQALTHSAVFVMELAGTDMFRVPTMPQPKFFKYLDMLQEGIDAKIGQVRQVIDGLTPSEQVYAAQLMKYRKYVFMTQAQSTIRLGGFKQVVLAANGFNPMAVALAELNPEVQFYCTDMDSTTVKTCNQMFKELGLKNIKYFQHRVGENSLFAELQNHTLTPNAPTYVQAEGLMYYLSEDDEHRFIEDVLGANPDNRLLFDFADAEELENPHNPLAVLHNGVTQKLHAGRGYGYRPEYYDAYPQYLDKMFGDRIAEIVPVQVVSADAERVDPTIDSHYFDEHNPCGYTVLMF